MRARPRRRPPMMSELDRDDPDDDDDPDWDRAVRDFSADLMLVADLERALERGEVDVDDPRRFRVWANHVLWSNSTSYNDLDAERDAALRPRRRGPGCGLREGAQPRPLPT